MIRIAGNASAAETPAQFGDRRDAVAAVEVVVDQKSVGFETARIDRRQRFGEVGRLEHAAAPAAEQRLHAVENGALVVDAQHDRAVEPAGVEPRRRGRSLGAAAKPLARGTSTEKREPRPTFDFSATSQSSTRAMRSTIDRPRPTPRATRAP